MKMKEFGLPGARVAGTLGSANDYGHSLCLISEAAIGSRSCPITGWVANVYHVDYFVKPYF